MIRKIINKLFNRAEPHGISLESPPIDDASLSMSVHQLGDQSSVVMEGYRFSATLQPTVPLKYLRRHGEIVSQVPEHEKGTDNAFYIWLPVIKSQFSFLSEGRTMSSSVGPIDPDGGEFLPFLIALREIVERPRDLNITDYEDALVRVDEILSLSSSSLANASDYLQKLFHSSQEELFPLVLASFNAPCFTGLSLVHLEQLASQGFTSVAGMIGAPDEVLLSLKGIGPSRLAKIRANNKVSEQDGAANPLLAPEFKIYN